MPNNGVIPRDQFASIVAKHMARQGSWQDVADEIGVEPGAVRQRAYRMGLKHWRPSGGQRRKWTKQLAVQALRDFDRIGGKAAAERYGLAPNQLHNRIYQAGFRVRALRLEMGCAE